ncbi:MAG: bifunctional UDP-N-acetylglucosamine diphosphorylase/glucosamine-1-phosphate N-acetyltransferase GlmU [bacterium]|nr:bifunctional UDP-N-acetylglucosamine diphosphorylase/glucosamine-1-phosphate N-acetyltransferase GlmU [bacterium]
MFTSVILAAGMGTRMKSAMPKVLHKVCGKALCKWVIDASKEAGADKVVTIIGHKADMVRPQIENDTEIAVQAEQKGTGHAVMQAAEFIKEANGSVVILNGDTPLITAETIGKAIKFHDESGNQATVITAILDDATGYGRIVRNAEGNVVKIVEHKDATEEERKINEINSGMYVFDAASLVYALGKLQPNNAQGEYYLTDTLEILLSAGKKIGAYAIENNDEIRGINNRIQLNEAETIMRERINRYHMTEGVTMINPSTAYIEAGVRIGRDTIIDANVELKGNTVIGEGCEIGQGSRIENAVIGNGVNIMSSVILDSEIGSNTNVGPFAYVRPNCKVGENVKVGDFVEIKNSSINDDTKISHLTYIGDSDVGKNVNFGCGTVTCNYDGTNKYRSEIGDNVFVGCNTNLVSPVKVGNHSYIAAGSTITEDVPEGSLSIARSRQTVKEGWADKKNMY